VLSVALVKTSRCWKAIARGLGLLLLAQVPFLGAAAQQTPSVRSDPSAPPPPPEQPAPAILTLPNATRLFTASDLAKSDDTTYGRIVSDRMAQPAKGRSPSSYSSSWPPISAVRERANPKAFIALSAGVYAMAMMDQQQTLSDPYWRINERDPLVKPFVHVPTPLFVAGSVALATGVNWLGWRMGRSRRWHKIWWLPQICSIGANAYGYQETRSWDN